MIFQDADTGDDQPSSAKKSRGRKTRTAEYYRQRFRKSFAQLLEEDAAAHPDPDKDPSYLSAQAPPPSLPPRRFCAVCGFPAPYSCTVCGTRFCSVRCQETHMETRCLKWTV